MFEELKLEISNISNDIIHIKDNIIDQLKEQNKIQAVKIKSLNQEILDIKTKMETGHQKSRENNLEISGLPNSIDDASLENTCIEILGKVGVDVTEHDIEGCRLPVRKGNPGNPVIIKFVNRKSAEKAIENARNLKNMDLSGVDGCNGDTKIFLGINLSPYFKSLDYHCRQLKKSGKIPRFL